MQYNASSSIAQNITFQMSAMLRGMAGHRADPVYVIEDRTRTFIQHDNGAYVNDAYSRRHGGPNNKDTTVKNRTRKQIVPFEAGGRYGIEPFLCKNEPPLDDANANPTAFKSCPPSDAAESRVYEDPGDAVLSELPAGPIEIGQSWTFSRSVVVGREEGYGSMNYVDTLQRIDEHGKQRIAVIDVTATGRINANKDLQSRGFHTATMTFAGTAEFDLGQGTPGSQHYTGRVEWHASIMGANIGFAYDEIYDAKPWTISAKQ